MIIAGEFLRHIAVKNKLKAWYCTAFNRINTGFKGLKMTSEQRLIEMEIKLAYQEDLLNELNLIVARQQKEIGKLEETCKLLYDKMKSLLSANEQNPDDNQPPPHY